MGWTHYWERKVELPSDEFKKAVYDCKKIIDQLDFSLAGFDGNGQPVFSDNEIIFNGVAGSNCEPFILRRIQPPRPGRTIVLEYCKTEHLPYDLAVQCCLIIINNHLKDLVTISSDGSEKDWEKASEICQKEFGFSKITLATK